jgi:hypothetical protein
MHNRHVNVVKARVREIEKTLPPGVVIEPYYDRTHVRVSEVIRNRAERICLREDCLSSPCCFSSSAMCALVVSRGVCDSALDADRVQRDDADAGLSGNLMSLGAIDFGLLVDGSVVMVDNILRRLARGVMNVPRRIVATVRSWQLGVKCLRPMTLAVSIIILVYLPDPRAHRDRRKDVSSDGPDRHPGPGRVGPPRRDCHPAPRIVVCAGQRPDMRTRVRSKCCAVPMNPVSDGRSRARRGW